MGKPSVVHNFQKSLELSNKYQDAEWWEIVYRKTFGDILSLNNVREDGWAQRGGIDRLIVLKSGKAISVDEKVRKEDWPDILLEYYSSEEKKIPGWIRKDLACDYIAYAFIPSKTCYMLPFLQLRLAWERNYKEWWYKCRKVEAKNEGYTTCSLAIPINELMNALKESMVVEW